MIIYVDADACPVITIVENMAKKHNIKSVLISDTNHILNSEYSDIITVDKGADSADFFIVNKCGKNDIVVTQDYGVAAMVLAIGGFPIHHNGRWYTDDNIGQMLMTRHLGKKARRGKHKTHIKGPKKRTEADDKAFYDSLERLILHIKSGEESVF